MTQCLHLVGFRGDEYHSIRRIWPDLPVMIHRIHDPRSRTEFGPDDIVVFANDEREDYIHPFNRD